MIERKPLRVMHIIARLNIGGAAASAILTADKLRDNDCETLLVCGKVGEFEGDMAYLAEKHAVDVHMIPSLGREISPLNDLKTVRQLMRVMREWKPDVVHTHTAKAGFVGRIAAWLARVPIRVHTFHGHVFHGYFSPTKTQFYLWLERFTARLSTRIISISAQQQRELTEKYHIAPAKKVAMLEYGFDLLPLTVSPPREKLDAFLAEHHIPTDKKLVGIVGRLVPIKNHAVFLQAAKRVADQRDDVHFILAGDGELREPLQAHVRELGLTERVTFTGWVRDIPVIYHVLSMLVLTSNNEGTPVSIIEGMVAGVPVISTDVGGVGDILREGELGAICPPGDSDAVAGAMLRFLDGNAPDVETVRQAALSRYDITFRATEMREFYDSLR